MAYEPERFAARPEGAYAMNMNINEFMKEVFKFEDKKVKIAGDYENPWFCGKDVCKALGYSDYKDALKKHVSERKKHNLSFILGGGVSPPPFTHNELHRRDVFDEGKQDVGLEVDQAGGRRF